jgi:hypothetical protein
LHEDLRIRGKSKRKRESKAPTREERQVKRKRRTSIEANLWRRKALRMKFVGDAAGSRSSKSSGDGEALML